MFTDIFQSILAITVFLTTIINIFYCYKFIYHNKKSIKSEIENKILNLEYRNFLNQMENNINNIEKLDIEEIDKEKIESLKKIIDSETMKVNHYFLLFSTNDEDKKRTIRKKKSEIIPFSFYNSHISLVLQIKMWWLLKRNHLDITKEEKRKIKSRLAKEVS